MDEKKIEEAANSSAEQNRWEVAISDDEVRTLCKKVFKEGANWAIQEFLKSLWHDASEEPDKSKSDILTLGFDADYTYLQFKDSILWQEESWRHSISRCCINQWAYLSDILPKQKGGE